MALCEPQGHPSIVHIEGALRAPVSGALGDRVEAIVGRGERRVVLDLAKLSDLDAAGVGEIVRAFTATSAAGASLRVARASAHVRTMLGVTGVWQMLSADRSRSRASDTPTGPARTR